MSSDPQPVDALDGPARAGATRRAGARGQASEAVLGRRLLLMLSLACGVGVANIYFPQAISPAVARSLHVAPSSASWIVTATQFGYALGIFFLVPLGDRVAHQRLLGLLFALTSLELLVGGLAPGLPMLIAASLCIGATTVAPQVIIPMAAGLVPPERRGTVTGTLLSGLIGGILLARAFGGLLAQWLGWRAPYLCAAAVTLALAAALSAALPATSPQPGGGYRELVTGSLRLFRSEPELRRSCFYQAAMFGAFNAAWTALTLLITGPKYGFRGVRRRADRPRRSGQHVRHPGRRTRG